MPANDPSKDRVVDSTVGACPGKVSATTVFFSPPVLVVVDVGGPGGFGPSCLTAIGGRRFEGGIGLSAFLLEIGDFETGADRSIEHNPPRLARRKVLATVTT